MRFVVILRIVTGLCAVVAGLSCSGGALDPSKKNDKDDDAGTNSEGDGSDAPAWVNSSYLTCSWSSVADKERAGATCSGGAVDVKLTVSLSVLGADGQPASDVTRAEKEEGKVEFIQPARQIVDRFATATLSDGSYQKELKVEFKKVLEGYDGNKLVGCFNSEVSVADCFAAIGINLPSSDDFIAKPEQLNPPTCTRKDTLPDGVPCEIYSDAMIGDFDLARMWFQTGNDLLAADGSVNHAAFCDAQGIKESFARGRIDRSVRYYPYLGQTEANICNERFHPENPKDHPFALKRVVFDPAHGTDGQWLCAFVLIDEPLLVSEFSMVRLHIIKNPAIFKDAANPEGLTLEALEKAMEHFRCFAKGEEGKTP